MHKPTIRHFVLCAGLLVMGACGAFEPSDAPCRDEDEACRATALTDAGARSDGGAADGGAGRDGGGDAGAAGSQAGTGGAGGSDGSVADATLDGALSDGGMDADIDAGPCGMVCPSATPVCDPTSGDCVQCVDADDCTGDEVCSPAQTCVPCNVGSDCKDPDNAQCDGNSCVPCTMDEQCAHIAGKNVCDEGQCVQCTGLKYAACGQDGAFDRVCDSKLRTCSTATVGAAATACTPCVSDAHCGSGMRCLDETFGAHMLSARCFHLKALVGCADTEASRRPFSETAMRTSLDGEAAEYCLATKTCQAYLDASVQKPCASPNDCGEESVSDGICSAPGGASNQCTYVCDHAYECPAAGSNQCPGGTVCSP